MAAFSDRNQEEIFDIIRSSIERGEYTTAEAVKILAEVMIYVIESGEFYEGLHADVR